MPSIASQGWLTIRAEALDEIENAHRLLHGRGVGRRLATQQINQAYTILLASQFQGFCRDFHSECADHLAVPIALAELRAVHLANNLHGRKLGTGNASPGNIGADFNRFGLSFWAAVDVDHPRNPQRKALLEELNRWRNAIAHDEFAPTMLRGGRPRLRLADVQEWRRACDGLVQSFDGVMHAHLLRLTGNAPWSRR
jgi:hypothetical protein